MNSKNETQFADIIQNPDLLNYLTSVSFSVPTPVQAESIPKLMGPGHFTVQSHTGTGKTLSYLLPLVSQLKAHESKDDPRFNGSPKAVIIAPTRELAGQIFSVVKAISHYAKLRVRKLVGGDKGKSLKSMFSTPIDILVTTPERCLRSLKNRELSKASLKYLILDEADHLLEPSFKNIMQQIAHQLQDNNFQLFLVSATRPAQFDETIRSFFPAFTLQAIGGAEGNRGDKRFSIFNLALEEKDKFIAVKDFIRQHKQRNGVIFTGSKARAQRLADELVAAGQKQLFLLHKDLEIEQRVEVSENFRKKGGILIATDIFARGIDVPHLKWVLNFDLPSEPYYYLHRSGRVGRSGAEGEVYNFITAKDSARVERINKALNTQGRADLIIDVAIPKKAPRTTSRTPAKSTSKSAPPSAPQSASKNSLKTAPKSTAKSTTKSTSKTASKSTPKGTPKKSLKSAPKTGPKNTSKSTTKNTKSAYKSASKHTAPKPTGSRSPKPRAKKSHRS